MRNFGLKVDKNKYKPLVSQRLRQQYPDLKKFFDNGEMEFVEAYNQFKSWRGYL
jgi:hypothetical protein